MRDKCVTVTLTEMFSGPFVLFSDAVLLPHSLHSVDILPLFPIRDQQTALGFLNHVVILESAEGDLHGHKGLAQFFGKGLIGVRNALCHINQPAVVHISGEEQKIDPDDKNCVSVRHGPDLLYLPILEEVRV